MQKRIKRSLHRELPTVLSHLAHEFAGGCKSRLLLVESKACGTYCASLLVFHQLRYEAYYRTYCQFVRVVSRLRAKRNYDLQPYPYRYAHGAVRI